MLSVGASKHDDGFSQNSLDFLNLFGTQDNVDQPTAVFDSKNKFTTAVAYEQPFTTRFVQISQFVQQTTVQCFTQRVGYPRISHPKLKFPLKLC